METKCEAGQAPGDVMQRQRQAEVNKAWAGMSTSELTAQEFIDSKILWHQQQIEQLYRVKQKLPPAITYSDLVTLSRNL